MNFFVYVFNNLGIHVTTNDENIVFWDATIVIEGEGVRFFTNIGSGVAGDDCLAGVAINK